MKKKPIIYKNAPLVETIFEIQFPGEPAIECQRDKFYDLVREKYPNVYVPAINTGKTYAFEPYRFEKEDKSSGLMISINKFAYYCRKYEGFNKFKTEVKRVTKKFTKLFKLKKINRTGLRYINIIQFIRENDFIPIDKYLNIDIKVHNLINKNFKSIKTLFKTDTKSGTITTHIESIISRDKTNEALILDFDYAKYKKLNISYLNKYLDESHTYTKRLFEEIITDNYRKYLRGDVI